MFSSLIESGSNKNDLKRRGTFFLGTLGFYGLLLAVAGIGSIYAYNVRLDDGNDSELVTLMRFPPSVARSEPVKREQVKAASSADRAKFMAQRPEISIQTPYARKEVASESTREVSARTPVIISNTTSDPALQGGPIGPDVPGGHNNNRFSNGTGDGPTVTFEKEPPPAIVVKKATPPPTTVEKVEKKAPDMVSLGVINGRATMKPVPPYPSIAKAAGISGVVTVQILVNEDGRVVSAHATNGHPLLRQAAVQAAYRAQFTQTLLSNRPVKVSGFITYNFMLQ